MSENQSPSRDVYSRLTGWRRVAIVVLGAISGALVALLFSGFSGQPTPGWEIILGTLGGAVLGLSASLGEVRRKKSPARQAPSSPHDE